MTKNAANNVDGDDDIMTDDDCSRGPYDGLTTLLACVGLAFSWCGTVMLAMLVGTDPDNMFTAPQSKPALYYFLHGGGILSVVSAGFLAAVTGHYGRLCSTARASFWILQAASITWAIIAYDIKDYVSWKAFGATGPVVWLSCILVFAGMNKSIWKKLDPMINLLAYLTAALALYAVAEYKLIDVRFNSGPVLLLVNLAWLSGWSLLTAGKVHGWRLWLRTFPFMAFTVTAVFSQTRSWILMSMLLLTAFFFVKSPYLAKDEETDFIRLKIIASLVIVVLVAAFLFQNELAVSYSMLKDRLYDDTRSGQYWDFFSQVPLSDLILGRGPTGVWFFGDREYQFFDNAFLWMLFIGGLPIAVAYTILVIVPGIKAFCRGATGDDLAASALLLLWGIACLGISTYAHPSLTPYSYLLCLLAGRCHGYLADTERDAEFDE